MYCSGTELNQGALSDVVSAGCVLKRPKQQDIRMLFNGKPTPSVVEDLKEQDPTGINSQEDERRSSVVVRPPYTTEDNMTEDFRMEDSPMCSLDMKKIPI